MRSYCEVFPKNTWLTEDFANVYGQANMVIERDLKMA